MTDIICTETYPKSLCKCVRVVKEKENDKDPIPFSIIYELEVVVVCMCINGKVLLRILMSKFILCLSFILFFLVFFFIWKGIWHNNDDETRATTR